MNTREYIESRLAEYIERNDDYSKLLEICPMAKTFISESNTEDENVHALYYAIVEIYLDESTPTETRNSIHNLITS
jgi:hypothetical protein